MHTTSSAALDPGCPGVETVETHVSTLAFTPDGLVHKRKKHVRFAFVDQSTAELREALCHREVELNRQFSPDVYVDVEEIVDAGGLVVDHAVLMHRMPAERRLATLVRQKRDVLPCLDSVAQIVAAHHSRAARSAEINAVASPESIAQLWDQNLHEMSAFVPAVLDPADLQTVGELAHRYLEGRDRLLLQRIDQDLIADGHGDLLADDIFCLSDGPRILDCLEFDDKLRWGDVLLDIGFLAMDLEHIGRPDLARYVLDRYELCSGLVQPRSLEHHYIGYRALVRAKVSCLKGSPSDRAEALDYIDLCQRHLLDGRVQLVLVGGLPGTGKTTLATGLADRLACSLLRSDEVRKELVGLGPLDHRPSAYGEALYAAPMKERTYRAIFDTARRHLELGDSVVVDASFSDARWRAVAREVAADCSADLTELLCMLSGAVAQQRLLARARRGGDASDADPAIAEIMSRHFDPWPDAIPVDTAEPADNAVESAFDHLSRPHR